jgi:hypothetical protein
LDIEKNFEKKIEKHRAEIADKIQINDPKWKKKKKSFRQFFHSDQNTYSRHQD